MRLFDYVFNSTLDELFDDFETVLSHRCNDISLGIPEWDDKGCCYEMKIKGDFDKVEVNHKNKELIFTKDCNCGNKYNSCRFVVTFPCDADIESFKADYDENNEIIIANIKKEKKKRKNLVIEHVRHLDNINCQGDCKKGTSK